MMCLFEKYVPAESMKSFQAYTNLVNEGVPLDILGKVADNIAHTSSQYLVVEERQLTHFLKQNLLGKLPSPFIITDTQKFMSQMDRSNKLFCEYDTSKPDLCIFSDKSTGFLISEQTDFINGLTLEGKRVEYAIGQCIANMIKFTTNLGLMALSKGHIIRKTLVNN